MSTATASSPAAAAYDPFEFVAGSGDGGDFETCPAGNYPGTMVGLIDMGHHLDDYDKSFVKTVHRAALIFEVDEQQKNGKPFLFAKQVNLPKNGLLNDKAALREILESWLGRKIADKEPCGIGRMIYKSGIVNITHSGSPEKPYANFNGIAPLMKGMAAPAPITPKLVYKVDASKPDEIPNYDWLPRIFGQKIADIIAGADEFKPKRPAGGNAMTQEELDDADLPF